MSAQRVATRSLLDSLDQAIERWKKACEGTGNVVLFPPVVGRRLNALRGYVPAYQFERYAWMYEFVEVEDAQQ